MRRRKIKKGQTIPFTGRFHLVALRPRETDEGFNIQLSTLQVQRHKHQIFSRHDDTM